MRWNPIRFDPNKDFTWGLNVVPEEARAAWGMRAQLEQNGIYWCNDRSSLLGDSDEKERLAAILNKTNIRKQASIEVKRLLDTGLLHRTPNRPLALSPEERAQWATEHYRDRPNQFVLAEQEGVVIVGDTQGSHGYLYLAAFFKPESMKIAKICERCYNEAGSAAEICSSCKYRLCFNCQTECEDCGNVSCESCRQRKCINGNWAVSEPCENFICPSEECYENGEKCVACEGRFCIDCEGDVLCKVCDAAFCGSCKEKLYPEDENPEDVEIEECEECGSTVHADCYEDCQECARREAEYDENEDY